MATICRLNPDHTFAEAREVTPLDPCPRGWVFADPPQPQKDKVAKWIGGQWMMMPKAAAQAHADARIAVQAAGLMRDAATRALNSSADAILAFIEAGKPIPAKWRVYRAALREIASGGSADSLPTRPE